VARAGKRGKKRGGERAIKVPGAGAQEPLWPVALTASREREKKKNQKKKDRPCPFQIRENSRPSQTTGEEKRGGKKGDWVKK